LTAVILARDPATVRALVLALYSAGATRVFSAVDAPTAAHMCSAATGPCLFVGALPAAEAKQTVRRMVAARADVRVLLVVEGAAGQVIGLPVVRTPIEQTALASAAREGFGAGAPHRFASA
jgi:hypothetical protein